jgi:hypothetical protein
MVRYASVVAFTIFYCAGASAQTLVGSGSGTIGSDPVAAPMSAPAATVKDFDSPLVALMPYDEASSAQPNLLPPNVSSALAPLLAYSAVIKNTSTQPIIAYTISWTSIDKNGVPYVDYRTICDAPSPHGFLRPGDKRLVTLLGPAHQFIEEDNSGHVSEEASNEAHRLQAQSAVTVALEAVMFSDGSALGEDHSQSLSQIRARLRAEYDLYKRVAESQDPYLLPGQLQIIADELKPGAYLDLRSDPYQTWYKFYQANVASRLIQHSSEAGTANMVSSVKSALHDNDYPALLIGNSK